MGIILFLVLAGLLAAWLGAPATKPPPAPARQPFQPRGDGRPPSDRLRAIAAQRRQERLARATVPELRFAETLRGLGLVEGWDYEREAVFFYPGSFALADYFFPRAALIVELDGKSHDAPGQREHDAGRDAYFSSIGLKTIRLSNRTVMTQPWVCQSLILAATGRAWPRPRAYAYEALGTPR